MLSVIFLDTEIENSMKIFSFCDNIKNNEDLISKEVVVVDSHNNLIDVANPLNHSLVEEINNSLNNFMNIQTVNDFSIIQSQSDFMDDCQQISSSTPSKVRII